LTPVLPLTVQETSIAAAKILDGKLRKKTKIAVKKAATFNGKFMI